MSTGGGGRKEREREIGNATHTSTLVLVLAHAYAKYRPAIIFEAAFAVRAPFILLLLTGCYMLLDRF